MQITLYNSSTPYYLAGQSGVSERVHSSAANIRISESIAIQESQRIRASHATAFDRQNLRTTIEFDTTRTFSDASEAEAWSLDYSQTYPRTGTLRITCGHAGLADEIREMADCIVEPPARTVIGCSVFLSYRITGGAITEYTPP